MRICELGDGDAGLAWQQEQQEEEVQASGGGELVRLKAKRALVGAGARVLFYPTLLYNVLRNRFEADFRWWDRVDQFILLGAVPFPSDVPRLKQLGVQGVVTLNEPYETLVPTSLYQANEIEHLVIPTRDYLFAPSLEDISQAIDFIHRNASQGGTTYVHCKAGRGRSTTIVLCYLIKYRNMTPEAALDHVRSIRPRVLLAPSQWHAVSSFGTLTTGQLPLLQCSDRNTVAAAPDSGIRNPDLNTGEDNVEEQAHCSPVPKKEHPPSEQLNSSNLPSFEDPTPPEDNSVPPPPPEEEWIPPPPPENEPAPPAPPEEPAASYVQVDTIPQPYIAQANVGYTISGMEYYGTVGTGGTNANYYMQVSEPHVLQAQQHSYYAPVSGSGISVSVDGTSIAPESYYTYPSVTMAASTVAAEHSGYYALSISAISSSAANIKTSSASLVSANSNSDLSGLDKVISNDASIMPLTQAVVATSAAGTSVLGSSTQSSSSTTNQTKVIRSKKRAGGITSSLRSNKKVSSLVDKWKAAKEELHDEEEEEPESALEALERKRQKEIEEWRKQQLASGEAQENANFVPVRGDWRDRVKRRRAEAKKESKDDIVAASLSCSEQHKGPPDLAELSKGLPTGWQAYLDESTKQVYYGNNLTSETSWEWPTK